LGPWRWSGMAEGRRLGVLGGTFDPVHNGHLVLAEAAREQLGLETVLFIPAGQPWRKTGREITAAEHRVEMVRLAIEDNPAFAVSVIEIQHRGPSYMVETLRKLQSEYAGAAPMMILGEDALADLPNWKEPEEIARLATLAVARRGEAGPRVPPDVEALGARVEWVEMPLLGISSTDVRRRVDGGRSIRYLVPAAVEEYIRERRLYTV
jgi:nicotinate-nucleotide adenylyltransferase